MYRFMQKDFPIFDGNPAEWSTFISQVQLVSSMCKFSNKEKMVELQKCLRRDKSAVAGMMICPSIIILAINTLEMRFGRPDQIIETLITLVRAIQPMRDQNLEKLIHFSNHVRNLVETIKSSGHLKNPQFLKELLGKIPDMLKLQWGDIMYDCGEEADLNIFSEWLNTRANAACYASTPSCEYEVLENFQYYSRFQTKLRQEMCENILKLFVIIVK
ncbi:hypothetical protein JTB14_034758 [Gonioctena quinquepunctata]|nr:hypothetical protein JTB14_034758 [Gonioctena quinquepunctata]